MWSIIITTLLLLGSISPCTAVTLQHQSTITNATISIPPEYLISDCDDRTPLLAHALDLALLALPAAISTARTGTASGNIFTAFFKRNSASGPVASMLTNILHQTPIRGRWPNLLKASGPEFVCVKPDTHDRYLQRGHLHFDPWMSCSGKNMYGFWARRSRYIFLCDYFFTRPISPPSLPPPSPTSPSVPMKRPASTCLRVNRISNSFVGFGNIVCLYQKYMLVHEMTHFYLGTKTLGLTTVPREEYDLTKCVELDEGLSMRNPQNYQALVAMVEQGCVDTPNPFRGVWDEGGWNEEEERITEVGNWNGSMTEGSDAAGVMGRYG